MASPSTADEAEAPSGDATPLPGTVQVAAGLHARRTPIIDTPRVRVLVGIGDVGRAARRFSALTGLSLSARRAMQAQRSDVGRQPVRPPDYWTGYQEEEEERAARTSTGDAALDKLIARRATAKRAAAARPRPQRGLPSTIHRRSHSIAGPMTAPGGMARRLLPATVVPAANPANSPQTAASREPRAARPTRPARPGQGDRPRPAAPPTTVVRSADRAASSSSSSSPAPQAVQRAADRAASSSAPAAGAVPRSGDRAASSSSPAPQAVQRSADRAASSSSPAAGVVQGSGDRAASSSAPAAGAVPRSGDRAASSSAPAAGAVPRSGDRAASSSAPAAGAVPRSADRGASSSSPSADAVRRTAHLDGSTPGAAVGPTPPAGRVVPAPGIGASTSPGQSTSSPQPSPSPSSGQSGAARGDASNPAVRRSAAPSELDPGAGIGDGPDWVGGSVAPSAVPTSSSSAGSSSTGTAPMDARSSARSARAEAAASDVVDVAPPWPGDLPELAEPAASPFATTIGRRVAVRPLLAGWRTPTAWRSIAAAPGLRLLPVGPAGLPTAWSSTSATSEHGTSSWADTVRRVVSESSSGPGAVRNLPVGGPTVVVREVAASEGSPARGRATGPERASTAGSARSADRAGSTSAAADRAAASRSRSSERVASTPAARAADRATAGPTNIGAAAAAAGRAAANAGRAAPNAGTVAAGRAAANVGVPTSPATRVAGGQAAAPSGAGTVARRAASAPGSRSHRTAPADTWSSLGGPAVRSGASGNPVLLRRHVTGSSAVEVTAWTLPPGMGGAARSLTSHPDATNLGATNRTTADPAASDAVLRRAPGFRPADARRPGGWLGRAAATSSTGAPTGGSLRVPMGPLGPVRWSARADEPVVARSTSPASSWAASVAAAASVMAGTSSLAGSAIRPPVANGLTLVRGGRADGSDLPVASIQRSSTHPAATRLRLVPPASAAAPSTGVSSGSSATTSSGSSGSSTGVSPGSSASTSSDSSTGVAAGSPAVVRRATSTPAPIGAAPVPAAYVGRAPAGSTPFVSIPGAVAAHGLPAARATLVGVTASGPAAGGAATPGVLGRLVHGEPVRRRLSFDLAPPAILRRTESPAASTASTARSTASSVTTSSVTSPTSPTSTVGPATSARAATARTDRPGLPATPAALARRRQAEQSSGAPSSGARSPVRVGAAGATWAQRVAAAAGTSGSPAALAALMAAAPAGPSWAQRSAADQHRTFTAPLGTTPTSGRRSRSDERPPAATGSPASGSPTPAGSSTSSTVRRSSADRTGATATTTTSRPGPSPARAGTLAPAAPTWAQRVAAAGQGRSLPAATPAGPAPTTPGSLVTPPVYATGGASVASLRGLPVAPAAFTIVRSSDVGAPVGGRSTSPSTTSSRSTASSSAVAARRADGTTSATIHRSRTPHGVSATVAGRIRGRRPALVADRWRATDVPGRALPGRGPTALRPLVAPATVQRTPLHPSAPGAAARFDEVLRTSDAPVRPVALPVRFRPLAERIIGRMPVQIATGVASQRALAAVGTTAATTGSVIHLPVAPDGSARTAGILAHELTHVAASSSVARFHGGRPSIEESAATQVERIVARAARTSGSGRGPASPGTSGLPVGGFVGIKGATAGPPVPASVAPSSSSSSSSSSSGSSGSSSGTVQRVVAQSEAPPPARTSRADRRIRRKEAPSAPAGLESVQQAADETTVLSDDALDAIVRALEVRLLESIERRGGLWRGGF